MPLGAAPTRRVMGRTSGIEQPSESGQKQALCGEPSQWDHIAEFSVQSGVDHLI